MTYEQFMADFGHIANAPGGVGRLRELIYHFAFAGELVSHSHETAAELAEVLAETISPTGRARRAVLEPAAGFYPIPPHWLWVNIGDVGHDWGQTKPSADFTYIDVSAIDNRRGVVAEGASVVSAANAPSRARKVVKKGTVIYSTVRPYLLNIAVIERDFDPAPIASTAFAILHPHDGVEAKFVYYFLRSPAFVAYVESVQSGIAYPAISDQKFFAASFPLAPTEEQKRIVAKVDELMALCDQLEAQQQERERRFPVLSRTCHARFAEAPTPANLNRIFDEIGAVSHADMRRSILALAVQGKLVSQDSLDAPAAVLLERIARQKQKMSQSRLFRQGKVSRPKTALDAPTELPSGWAWVNVNSICFKVTDGTHFTPRYTTSGVRFVSAKDIVGGKLVFDRCKFITSEEHQQLFRRCNPEFHDIVISKSGSIGSVALIEDRGEFSLFESLALLKFDQNSIFPNFLVYALGHACSSLTSGHIRGVGVKHLHLDILRGLELALPPLAEQRRIVAKVDELMALVDQLEAHQQGRDKLAKAFAKACIVSFTGTTQLERPKKMKAPKTELVSLVTLSKKPQSDVKAPLAQLLIQNKRTLPAKTLWQQSGLTIDAFYQQLKTEIAQGWIAPPAEAEMKVLEEV